MKFTAAGDMIIQKPIYPGYAGFGALADFIKQGDARFFNLETTLNHEGETYASQFSGGTYIRTDPEILDDIKPFGFNMTSANNNHALDFPTDVHELLKKRSKDFTVGLMTDKRMFRSVIPYWETEGTKLTKMTLLPIEMSMDGNKSQQGLPFISNNPEIGEYLAGMCAPYGTKITPNDDGTLSCSW